MLVEAFLTTDFMEHNVYLKIVRKEVSDGFFELERGDIMTENGDHLSLSGNDIRQLAKLFSAAEDKGICI